MGTIVRTLLCIASFLAIASTAYAVEMAKFGLCPGTVDITEFYCALGECETKNGENFDKYYSIDASQLGPAIGYTNLHAPTLGDETVGGVKHADSYNSLAVKLLKVKNDGEECYIHERPDLAALFADAFGNDLGLFPYCRGPLAKWKIAIAPANYTNLTTLKDDEGQYEKELAKHPLVNFVNSHPSSLPGPFAHDGQCEFFEVDEGPLEADMLPMVDDAGNTEHSSGVVYDELFAETSYMDKILNPDSDLAAIFGYPYYQPIGEQTIFYANTILWDWDNFCFGDGCYDAVQILIFESDDQGFPDDVMAHFTVKQGDPSSHIFENENLRIELMAADTSKQDKHQQQFVKSIQKMTRTAGSNKSIPKVDSPHKPTKVPLKRDLWRYLRP